MLPRPSVTKQSQAATKRIVLCCGCGGLLFAAMVWFGLLQRIQASENILPDRQVSATPTKIQPQFVASYGKLPLSFEANQGQTDARVRFLARGRGYTIFLTDDEAVLTLRKSQPRMSRLGKFGLPGRLEPFGPVDPRAGRWPSRADDWKSLWRSLIPDLGELVPQPNAGKGGVAAGLESQPPQVLRMRLVGGNAKGRVVGLDELPGHSNYFIGNDPKKWRTNVPNYARVKYENVYRGVDLLYYGNQGSLEYDLVVSPGADPSAIKLAVQGAQMLHLDAEGNVVGRLGGGELRLHRPLIYQFGTDNPRPRVRNGKPVEGRYLLTADACVRFEVPNYDRSKPLVIDPVLTYSTYLGGEDGGLSIAVDASGNAYVFGGTYSTDFPTTPGAVSQTNSGGADAFVAKLNATGSALLYSTYLGGSGDELTWGGSGIAVSSSGEAYVTGGTISQDFPTTPGSFQPTPSSGTCFGGCVVPFVTKLNAEGSALAYSTYLSGGETDWPNAIVIDSEGNAYVVGQTLSPNFPTTAGAFDRTCVANGVVDAFVSKLNVSGSALVYSTCLGGSNYDVAGGIALDGSQNAYVTGYTNSPDFPTSPGAFQPMLRGSSWNAFFTKLNAPGSALVCSTYLGGSKGQGQGFDAGDAIAVDSSGNAYIAGDTFSTDFPTTSGAFQTALPGTRSGFITKVAPDCSTLAYSTYLGGSNADVPSSIAVDAAGNAYMTGAAYSGDFPTTASAFQSTLLGSGNAFVTKVNPEGTGLVYSTYLGGSGDDNGYGIAVDSSGSAYVTGTIRSPLDFPITSGAFQTVPGGGGGSDAFVAKITSAPLALVSRTSLSFGGVIVGSTTTSQSVTLTNNGDVSLAISSVAISDDFAQTNTCGSSVNVNASCTISVTFTPSAAGARTGSLTITDDAPGSTQSVALSGTGQDFTLAAASGSSTSATVAPGQSATYTLSVAGEGGFNQSVSFTCTGAPSEATCTVSPSTLTPGSSATNITVSVTTTAPSASVPRSRPLPPTAPLLPGLRGLLMLALVLAMVAWAFGCRNQPGVSRWRSAMVPLASGLLLTLALAGCGGGGSSTNVTHNPGTPAGTYTLTVTGSTGSGSSALSHSVTLTLTVS